MKKRGDMLRKINNAATIRDHEAHALGGRVAVTARLANAKLTGGKTEIEAYLERRAKEKAPTGGAS